MQLNCANLTVVLQLTVQSWRLAWNFTDGETLQEAADYFPNTSYPIPASLNTSRVEIQSTALTARDDQQAVQNAWFYPYQVIYPTLPPPPLTSQQRPPPPGFAFPPLFLTCTPPPPPANIFNMLSTLTPLPRNQAAAVTHPSPPSFPAPLPSYPPSGQPPSTPLPN